jgi:hypothetical protein
MTFNSEDYAALWSVLHATRGEDKLRDDALRMLMAMRSRIGRLEVALGGTILAKHLATKEGYEAKIEELWKEAQALFPTLAPQQAP